MPKKGNLSVYFFATCQNIPSPRYEQASSLIGARFYFFGGQTISFSSNEVWYLDLSNSFNKTIPPWRKDVGMPVGYSIGGSCVSPIDNSSVFLVGGRTFIPNTFSPFDSSSPVYVFNSKTSQWAATNINGLNSSFLSRNEIQAVIDNSGKMFMFGGTNVNSTLPTFYNDMNILDINTMTWSTQTSSSSLLSYVDYSATLLPNGIIVYIGGRGGSSSSVTSVTMSQILIFDTQSYSWSTKVISGAYVGARNGHSAVLTMDGNIILYGGSTLTGTGSLEVLSDIAIINTNTWVWSVPSVSQTNTPPPLTFHSATLYKNYMIVAFGLISSTPVMTLNNDIYILDAQNYSWVTQINQNTLTTSQSTNNTLYIGIGIGASVIILVGIFVAIILFYRRRHNSDMVLATPGTITEASIYKSSMNAHI
ncbi:galactose oxidase [Gigaspora margarita]|uniref:Galactose oxidase n=1 Tax=Gigaspora margarita TaxID=4874 RepID=A0A8H4ABJ5_GIGMA|nr:galactose oxidase [Gigaspora margarita]